MTLKALEPMETRDGMVAFRFLHALLYPHLEFKRFRLDCPDSFSCGKESTHKVYYVQNGDFAPGFYWGKVCDTHLDLYKRAGWSVIENKYNSEPNTDILQ